MASWGEGQAGNPGPGRDFIPRAPALPPGPPWTPSWEDGPPTPHVESRSLRAPAPPILGSKDKTPSAELVTGCPNWLSQEMPKFGSEGTVLTPSSATCELWELLHASL